MLIENIFVLLPTMAFPALLLLFVRALGPVVCCLRAGKRTEALSFLGISTSEGIPASEA